MNAGDAVYKHIYDGAIKAGATEWSAQNEAAQGSDDYRKGRFSKVSELITSRIKKAKQLKQ